MLADHLIATCMPLSVRRDGAREWPTKAVEFNAMAKAHGGSTALRSDSALRHRWIALSRAAEAEGAPPTDPRRETSSTTSAAGATAGVQVGSVAAAAAAAAAAASSVSKTRKRKRKPDRPMRERRRGEAAKRSYAEIVELVSGGAKYEKSNLNRGDHQGRGKIDDDDADAAAREQMADRICARLGAFANVRSAPDDTAGQDARLSIPRWLPFPPRPPAALAGASRALTALGYTFLVGCGRARGASAAASHARC